MNLTRRQLAGLAALAAQSAPAFGQTPPQPAADLDQAARESNQRNADSLSRVELPLAVEPAFQFKA